VAKDRFHQVVKKALESDGWNVTHDPLQIKVGGVDMEIDLGAERLLAAERGDEKIAVEVKSFLALCICNFRVSYSTGAVY